MTILLELLIWLYANKKSLIIFAHARAESLSVGWLEVLVQRVVVDQLEVEAAVATLGSTFGKSKPRK
jgi:hypothetical protein